MLEITVTRDLGASTTVLNVSTDVSSFAVLILPHSDRDHETCWRCEIRWSRATFLGRGASPEGAFNEGLNSLRFFGGRKPLASCAEWALVRARLAELGAFALPDVISPHRSSGTFRVRMSDERTREQGRLPAKGSRVDDDSWPTASI